MGFKDKEKIKTILVNIRNSMDTLINNVNSDYYEELWKDDKHTSESINRDFSFDMEDIAETIYKKLNQEILPNLLTD